MMSKGLLRNVIVLAITTAVILGRVYAVQSLVGPGLGNPGGAASVATSGNAGRAPLAVGSAAMDFTAVGIDGQSVHLNALKGKPVWLVFEATWCADCRSEAPDIQAVSAAFAGRATVVGIFVGESQATVEGYANRLKLTMPCVPDTDQAIVTAYSMRGMAIPSHIFIDSQGIIRQVVVGGLSERAATDIMNSLA